MSVPISPTKASHRSLSGSEIEPPTLTFLVKSVKDKPEALKCEVDAEALAKGSKKGQGRG